MVLEVRNIRLKIRLDEPEHYIVKVLASDLFVEDLQTERSYATEELFEFMGFSHLNKRQSKYI